MGAYDGRLLVALPLLEDPNFERTVVLVLGHDDDGALGVVLNRPTRTPIGDVMQDWAPLAAEPAWLFGGGPVEPRAVVGLAVSRPGRRAAGTVVDRICTIDPSSDPLLLADDVEKARLFAGYAGWGPGQLEEEVAEGAWVVVDAETDDVVAADPDNLWRTVLQRQAGTLGLLASYPDDPRLN